VKILVIEDEPDIRRNLEYNLSREGFSVSAAASISEANTLLATTDYNLIPFRFNVT
jgi:two-component system phosphate regulon response regulator PhoB